jgi:Transposase DDE domain
VFEAVMDAALRPLADEQAHPQAFYAGLRLVGLDGTRFSCANTPRILGQLTKAASRRFDAAFAKLGCALLVELGTHAPLAAAVAQQEEGELALAGRLLERLPPKSLLLADRLYGSGAFLVRLQKAAERAGQQSAAFLVRVSRQPRSRLVEAFADGSALVVLTPSRQPEDRPADGAPLLVREIRARVRRPGSGWSEVRLWTSLLDARAHPALELVALYARRWEWEVFAREMKIDLRASGSALTLASHTLHSAAQEIAALFLAMALLARARLEAGTRAGVEALRISFGQTLALLGPHWQLLSIGADLLSPAQRHAWVERLFDELTLAVLPKRRKRTCPRALRQPVTNYPRLTKNTQQKGTFEYEIEPLR